MVIFVYILKATVANRCHYLPHVRKNMLTLQHFPKISPDLPRQAIVNVHVAYRISVTATQTRSTNALNKHLKLIHTRHIC